MNPNRSWMYQRTVKGTMQSTFVEGVEAFIDFALKQTHCLSNGKMKCPCNSKKCRNLPFHPPTTVAEHLKRNGFVPHYEIWNHHGETAPILIDYTKFGKGRKRKHKNVDNSTPPTQITSQVLNDRMEEMVFNAAGPEFVDTSTIGGTQVVEEPPNPETQEFFNMMEAAKRPLYEGCKMNELTFLARSMSCKANGGNSEQTYNSWIELLKDALPEPNLVPTNFYQAQKKMKAMGLPME